MLVRISPKQLVPRRKIKEVPGPLRQSVAHEGIRFPIIAGEANDDGKHPIIDGDKRRFLANALRSYEVECVLIPGDVDKLRLMWHAGQRRPSITDVAEMLAESEASDKEVAAMCTRRKTWVKLRRKLADSPEDVRTAFHRGHLRAVDLERIVRCSQEGQIRRANRMLETLTWKRDAPDEWREIHEIQAMLGKLDPESPEAAALVWVTRGLTDEQFESLIALEDLTQQSQNLDMGY